MKIFNSFKLLAYSLLVLVLGVACEDSSEIKDPVDVAELISPFSMNVAEDSLSVNVSYDAEAQAYQYVTALFEIADFVEIADEQLVAAIKDAASEMGAEIGSVDNKYIFEGDAVVKLEDWGVEEDSKYILAAVAYNSSLEQVSEVESIEVVTPAAPEPDSDFQSVEISNIAADNFTVTVKVGAYQGNYTIIPSSLDEIESFGGKESYAEAFLEDDIAYYGTDYSVVDDAYVFSGDVVFNISDGWNIESSSDYVVMVFGVEGDGSYANVVSEIVVTDSFQTLEGEVVEGAGIPDEIALSKEAFGSVEISNITSSSYDYSVEPADDNMSYLIFQFTEEEYNVTYPSDEERIMAIYGVYDYLAPYYDTTFAEFIKGSSAPGAYADSYTELDAESTYYFVAFGIDLDTFQPLTAVESKVVTTLAAAEPTSSMNSISISDVTFDDGTISVDAGSYADYYHVYPISAEMLDDEDVTVGYAGDAELAIEEAVAYLIDAGYEFTPDAEYSYLYYFTGSQNIQLSETVWVVEPETDYYLLAAGFDAQGNLTTEVVKSEMFTTGVAPEFDIDIEVSDITDTSAVVTFTPNIKTVYYYNNIMLKSEFEALDLDVLTSDFYFTYYLSYGPLKYDPDMVELAAGNDYYAVAFAYDIDAMEVSSEVFSVPFKTTGEQLPPLSMPTEVSIPDVDFGEVVLVGEEASGPSIDILPNDDVENYVYFYVTADEYAELGSDEALVLSDCARYQDDVDNEYEANYRNALTYYLRQGDNSRTEGWLEPDTDYIFYAYGVDVMTGLPSTAIEKLEYTTPAAQSAVPAIAKAPQRRALNDVSYVTRFSSVSKMVRLNSLTAPSVKAQEKIQQKNLQVAKAIEKRVNSAASQTLLVHRKK